MIKYFFQIKTKNYKIQKKTFNIKYFEEFYFIIKFLLIPFYFLNEKLIYLKKFYLIL
jgi:hypothetical protein